MGEGGKEDPEQPGGELWRRKDQHVDREHGYKQGSSHGIEQDVNVASRPSVPTGTKKKGEGC